MNVSENLQTAIDIVGLQPLATHLGVTYQAIRKWQRENRMPRTEWTGETCYSLRIDEATNGVVPKEALLVLAA